MSVFPSRGESQTRLANPKMFGIDHGKIFIMDSDSGFVAAEKQRELSGLGTPKEEPEYRIYLVLRRLRINEDFL